MYHSGNSELEQLEDRHYRFNQKLSELEWDYADMRDVYKRQLYARCGP